MCVLDVGLIFLMGGSHLLLKSCPTINHCNTLTWFVVMRNLVLSMFEGKWCLDGTHLWPLSRQHASGVMLQGMSHPQGIIMEMGCNDTAQLFNSWIVWFFEFCYLMNLCLRELFMGVACYSWVWYAADCASCMRVVAVVVMCVRVLGPCIVWEMGCVVLRAAV